MQDTIVDKGKKEIKPWRDGIVVGIATFFVTFTCSTVMYVYAQNGLLHEVQETLLHVARTAAVMTDGDLHQTLTDNSQKGSPDYLRVQKPYREILSVNSDIKYIYTVIEKNDKAYFIIDTGQEAGRENIPEKDRKTTANIMEEYPDIPPIMFKALRERQEMAENETYTDEWGTFVSAYVPIYNGQKEYIGIVGADIDATDFLARMHAIRLPYLVGLLFALIFSAAMAVVIRYVRAAHMARLASRTEQLTALRKFHRHISDVTRMVADISFKIDGKTAQISGMAQTSMEKTILAARSIQGSSDKVQSIADAAERLLQVVQGLSGTMDAYAQSLKENIQRMTQSRDTSQQIVGAAKNISSVVDIINDITERIDLLALNAAIEAARAGDAGKGFAVVAGEVKMLAGQARQSTGRIANNISEMNEVVRRALSSMEDTGEIQAHIDVLTQKTQQVISEQQDIVQDIHEDIKDVTQRSAEIIDMVNVIAEMSSDTSTKTTHMHKDVHRLYEQNSALNVEVENFVRKM